MLRELDLLVLLKLVAKGEEGWTQMGIARELGMSSQSVNVALERSRVAKLYSPTRKAVRRHDLYQAMVAGRYFLATELGGEVRGLPTATGGPLLRDLFAQTPGGVPVWPDPEGTVRGPCLEPLHPNVPAAARADTRLYGLLSLFDSIRIGDARERAHATERLKAELDPA